jgi:hypothetical protein
VRIDKIKRQEKESGRVFLDYDGSGTGLAGYEITDAETQGDDENDTKPENNTHRIPPEPIKNV